MNNNEWSRLARIPITQPPLPGLAVTTLELSLKGVTLQSLGTITRRGMTSAFGQPRPMPESLTFSLDVSTPNEVAIVDRAGQAIASAVFADNHPADWITALSESGRVVLVITEDGISSYNSTEKWLNDAHFVALPLAIRGWDTGVGIVPPGFQGT